MNTQNVLDFCSGGGGFSLSMSVFPQLKTVAFCENDPHAIAVLKKNFPGVPIIEDIHDISINTLQSLGIQRIDGIVGGFPCQPHSEAGTRKASQDDRDLWPEIARILCEIQPRWSVFENVLGLLSSESGEFFKRVQWDLASLGYATEWGVIPCASVEASDGQFIGAGGVHRRERVWIIAYSNSNGCGSISDNRGEGYFQKNAERDLEANQSEWPRQFCGTGPALSTANSYNNVRGSSNQQILEPRSTIASECSDAIVGDTNSDRCEQQLSKANSGMQSEPVAESIFCSGNDGLPHDLGRYLMRPSDLDRWLPFATIPTIQRPLRLSSRELKQLSPEDRAEYKQLCDEYREEYNRAIESLCDAEKKEYRQLLQEYKRYRLSQKQQLERYGNAIVPQVAIKVFARLIEILENQPCS